MNSNKTKSEEEKPNKKDLGLIVAVGLLAIGILSVFIPFDRINGAKIGSFTINIDRYNNLGEFIGGVTTPFLSIAAFILLYLTYKSQKKELEESQKILRTQNEVMTKQQFETTFFNMINLHNQIVNQMNITYTMRLDGRITEQPEKTTKHGGECFEKFYNSFHDSCIDYEILSSSEAQRINIVDSSYVNSLKDWQSILGQYFTNLYQIVKFVDNAAMEETDKKTYTNILRAQLSRYELLVLYFNCLSRYGKENFKPLVEKYSLLKNIADFRELSRFNCESLYDPKAFGK